MASKVKISVTVDEELMARVDAAAENRPRSMVVEEALAVWVGRQRKKKLDRDIEAYYSGMTDADREEDDAWAALGDESVEGWSRG